MLSILKHPYLKNPSVDATTESHIDHPELPATTQNTTILMHNKFRIPQNTNKTKTELLSEPLRLPVLTSSTVILHHYAWSPWTLHHEMDKNLSKNAP
jgi:hypothetical protein